MLSRKAWILANLHVVSSLPSVTEISTRSWRELQLSRNRQSLSLAQSTLQLASSLLGRLESYRNEELQLVLFPSTTLDLVLAGSSRYIRLHNVLRDCGQSGWTFPLASCSSFSQSTGKLVTQTEKSDCTKIGLEKFPLGTVARPLRWLGRFGEITRPRPRPRGRTHG